MPCVFHGNFDFEHELATRSYNRPMRIRRLNAEMTSHLLAISDVGDHLYYSCDPPVDFLEEASSAGFPSVQPLQPGEIHRVNCTCVSWGWSRPAFDFATSMGWETDGPSSSAVHAANSRQLSFDMEKQRESGLPGQSRLVSLDELDRTICDCASIWQIQPSELSWLLKAEFGMSGRERIAGTGTSLENVQRNWIQRRLKVGECLYFEPRVVSLMELSTQWIIHKSSPGDHSPQASQFLGATELVTDAVGQFLGSIPFPGSSTENWYGCEAGPVSGTPAFYDRMVADARQVTDELQRLGYHGPAGIDAMVYRGPNGQPAIRSIQDINARFTMGRIAIEWCQRFARPGSAAWLLVPVEWFCGETDIPTTRSSRRRLTSPWTLSGKPVQRVGVLFSERDDWMSFLTAHL